MAAAASASAASANSAPSLRLPARLGRPPLLRTARRARLTSTPPHVRPPSFSLARSPPCACLALRASRPPQPPPRLPTCRRADCRCCSFLRSAAKDEDTGEMVAIKKITNAFEHHTFAKRTLREITLMRMMQHENVRARCSRRPRRLPPPPSDSRRPSTPRPPRRCRSSGSRPSCAPWTPTHSMTFTSSRS